jgi:hypothetical protein
VREKLAWGPEPGSGPRGSKDKKGKENSEDEGEGDGEGDGED